MKNMLFGLLIGLVLWFVVSSGIGKKMVDDYTRAGYGTLTIDTGIDTGPVNTPAPPPTAHAPDSYATRLAEYQLEAEAKPTVIVITVVAPTPSPTPTQVWIQKPEFELCGGQGDKREVLNEEVI